MSQVLDRLAEKSTFARLQLESSFAKTVEDTTKIVKVFLKCFSQDYDIIHVHKALRPLIDTITDRD